MLRKKGPLDNGKEVEAKGSIIDTRVIKRSESKESGRQQPPVLEGAASESEASTETPLPLSFFEYQRGRMQNVLEVMPDHSFDDLKEMPDSPEKERILQEVFSLMSENYFKNVPPEERARKGCIFHVAKDMEDLRKRVEDAACFLIMLRKDDSRLMAFVELTSDNRVLQLKQEKLIQHPLPRRLEVVEKYSHEGRVIHEQLIVADKKMGVKGIGAVALKEALRIAIDVKKVAIITTEIQTVPPNSKSQTFHLDVGFGEIGTIQEHFPDLDPVNFTLYALPLTEDAASQFHGDTPSAPTLIAV